MNRVVYQSLSCGRRGEFCDAQDEPIDLPADALIGIAHPLEMTAEMRSEFAQLFADFEIMRLFASCRAARCCSHLTSRPVTA
ncbi:DUF4132 domain-containing protein [Shigella flexneri]